MCLFHYIYIMFLIMAPIFMMDIHDLILQSLGLGQG